MFLCICLPAARLLPFTLQLTIFTTSKSRISCPRQGCQFSGNQNTLPIEQYINLTGSTRRIQWHQSHHYQTSTGRDINQNEVFKLYSRELGICLA
ncbi:hypothetical protein GGR50DRAFT_398962 [Xylaria sp. CBS 124048]|nr:hypothetical protein GGR50DRAFT_398962 [Xylaria sp. CBS 124048]